MQPSTPLLRAELERESLSDAWTILIFYKLREIERLPTPWTDGFMRHGDATLEQEFLHVAVAQGEPIVEPDPMADDFAGKAVVLVTLGVGRRGHAGVPILGFI